MAAVGRFPLDHGAAQTKVWPILFRHAGQS
jgi:hypothetical protein